MSLKDIEKKRLEECFNDNTSYISSNSIDKSIDDYWNKYGNKKLLSRFNIILKNTYNILKQIKDTGIIEYEESKLRFHIIPNFCKEGRTFNIKNNNYNEYYWNIITVSNTSVITPLFKLEFDLGTYKLKNNISMLEFNKYLKLEGNIYYLDYCPYNLDLTSDKINTYYMIPSNIMKEEFNKIK